MAKQLMFDSQAKEKILSGIDKLEKAVSVTLGPAGKNVIIDEYGTIHSTRDGVTVAKAVVLKDKFENLGANAIREVAEKSNKCGDGTTTSTVLAASIFRNGLKYVSLGSNATQIKNGIKKAADFVVEDIKSKAKKISTKDEIKRVAVVSSNHDEEIGETIADVMSKIGNDGTVKVENGNTTEIHSKIVEGMVIDQSYVSPYMVTNAETGEAELENPYVLIADKKLANIQELIDCLQSVSKVGASLLIIAESLQEDILATLVMNKLRGFNCVAVNAPSFGENRKAILEDIAILTGGKVVSDETNVLLKSAVVGSPVLGQAKKVVVNKESTVIIGGCGDQEAVDTRVKALRSQIEKTSSDYDKQKLEERLAKLTSGIGIISVGAQTETERKELRDRVDDAFAASKAAVRGGVVAGGGVALLRAMANLDLAYEKDSELYKQLSGDEIIGVKILCDALEAPVRKILSNAGIDSSLVVAKLKSEGNSSNVGYDVLTKKYVDMLEAGIIDPAEVVINEVKNASSIASLLLTTECLIVDGPEENKETGVNNGMMPGMM